MPHDGSGLDGRRAVVMGGTAGIGLATAQLLGERGARVAVFGAPLLTVNPASL